METKGAERRNYSKELKSEASQKVSATARKASATARKTSGTGVAWGGGMGGGEQGQAPRYGRFRRLCQQVRVWGERARGDRRRYCRRCPWLVFR
jgi:hypothetical protein